VIWGAEAERRETSSSAGDRTALWSLFLGRWLTAPGAHGSGAQAGNGCAIPPTRTADRLG